MRLLRLLARMPAAERRALTAAVVWCTVASVVLKVIPFRTVAAWLGRTQLGTASDEGDRTMSREESAIVRRVAWAVSRAARWLPWKPVCLPQAVTAQWMLRRSRIPSTLYLGIDPNGSYDAHAWVRSGRVIVTGGPSVQRYAVVAAFASVA